MRRTIFLVLAALPTLAGCSIVIGESFSGYTVAPLDASAESGRDGAASDASAEPEGDGATSHVGDPCVMDTTCGSAPTAKCFDQGNTSFPGGYCTLDIGICSVNTLCPIGASCATLGGGQVACYKNCDSNADCRTPEYECLTVDPLYVSGASHKVCYPTFFGCYMSSNCPTVKPTCTADGGPGYCQ